MATDAENAATSLSNRLARLAEIDAVSVFVRATMTYTDENGRSMGWGQYRQQLVAEIEALQGKGNESGIVQKAAGPFTIFG